MAKDQENKTEQQEAVFRVVGQYAKDVSLECPMPVFAEGAEQVNVAMDVAVSAKSLENDNQHEVLLKLSGEAKDMDGNVRYLAEVEYAGVFQVEGIPDEHLPAVLSIDGAALLFPFVRQVFMDLVATSGYRPGMLDPINFQALFLQAQKQTAEKSA